jgi:hypothetical protein
MQLCRQHSFLQDRQRPKGVFRPFFLVI